MKIFLTYFGILRSSPAKRLSQPLKRAKLKAGKNGCWRYSGEAGKNSHNIYYQFWRQDNQPIELYSPGFTVQKLNYVHNNPVEAGLVDKPEDYLYSSARSYVRTGQVGLLEVLKI
jgi:hypothetical protein